MAYETSWEDALKYFLEAADRSGGGNKIAIANICRYIMNEYHGIPLKLIRDLSYSRLHIGVADGTAPSKELVVMPIEVEETHVEIYLRDNETRIEHCYFPHPIHTEALDRFKKIINKLNWYAPVKENNPFLDWLRD
jgi:hypothetical protein